MQPQPHSTTHVGTNSFTAVVEGHSVAEQVSQLRWRGLCLRVPLAPQFPQGANVVWSIAPDQVRLLSNTVTRPMSPDDTLFEADLVEVTEVGTTLRILTRVAGEPTETLVMEADSTIARQHDVRPGARLNLRLRGSSIRVAPYSELLAR